LGFLGFLCLILTDSVENKILLSILLTLSHFFNLIMNFGFFLLLLPERVLSINYTHFHNFIIFLFFFALIITGLSKVPKNKNCIMVLQVLAIFLFFMCFFVVLVYATPSLYSWFEMDLVYINFELWFLVVYTCFIFPCLKFFFWLTNFMAHWERFCVFFWYLTDTYYS
jgi:hypothetical protein